MVDFPDFRQIANYANQSITTVQRELNDYLEGAKGAFNQGERALDNFIQEQLPRKVQGVASKAIKAIPETVITGTVISGHTGIGLFLGAVRLTLAALPMIQDFLNQQEGQVSTEVAVQQVSGNMNDMLEKFRVGIAVAAAVTAVATAVFGWASPNLTLCDIVAKTAFWALISQTALIAWDDDAVGRIGANLREVLPGQFQ